MCYCFSKLFYSHTMDNKQCTRTPSKCLSLPLDNTKKKWLSPSSGTYKWRTSSEPKAKYVWMHAWLSLGNFCIPQSTPFTWMPKPCGYAASVVLANCKGKHWKFRRRRICSTGKAAIRSQQKQRVREHAESFSFLIFEKEQLQVITYTFVRVFYYWLIINRFLPKHQSVRRLIFKIPEYLTDELAECHGRTYRPIPIPGLGGPHLFRGPVRAPTSHTLFDGPACYHWSGDRHRNGSHVKRGLYHLPWIVLRLAIPGVAAAARNPQYSWQGRRFDVGCNKEPPQVISMI